MINNNAKTILFASLIAAMVLPFSSMNYANAKMTESQTQRIQDLFAKANIIVEKIHKQQSKAQAAETEEPRNIHLVKIEKLDGKLTGIDAKINRLAPITDKVTGTSEPFTGVLGESSQRHTVVSKSQIGCDEGTQNYDARLTVSTISDTSYWTINYPSSLSVDWSPLCWDSSFVTYEIVIQNHSQGWLCAGNNRVGNNNNDTFQQTCSDKQMHTGDLMKVVTIAHYSNYQVSDSKYLVL